MISDSTHILRSAVATLQTVGSRHLMRCLERDWVRFVLAGVGNTAVGYLLYLLLLLFLPCIVSFTLAFVTGIGLSYLLNTFLVFRKSAALNKALWWFAVYVAQYVLGVLLLRVVVNVFGVDVRLAPLPVIVLTFPVTFLLSRIIIRGRQKDPPAAIGRFY